MIIRLWKHLTNKRRIQFLLLLLLMILASITEVVSIGSIVPFLGALTSPEQIFQHNLTQPLIKIFSNGKIGEFYNIGSNNNLNNLEICKYLIKIAKTKINIGENVKIKFVKDRPGHDQRYALNSSKIIKFLKWKPKIKLTKGLTLTFNWYLKNRDYFSYLKKKDITKRLGNNYK